MNEVEWATSENSGAYLSIMNAFLKASLSGNYDLDNIAQSVE